MSGFEPTDFDEVVTTLAGRTDTIGRALERGDRLVLVIEAKVETLTAGPKTLVRATRITDAHELSSDIGRKLLNQLRTARSLAADMARGGPILPGLEGFTDVEGVVMDAANHAVVAGDTGWVPDGHETAPGDPSGPGPDSAADPDADPPEPWDGYSKAKVGDIIGSLDMAAGFVPAAERRATLERIQAFESTHKARVTILDYCGTALEDVPATEPGADALEFGTDPGPADFGDMPDDDDDLELAADDDLAALPDGDGVDGPTVDDFAAAFGDGVEVVDPGNLL